MDLIIDANIIFAGLIKDGKTAEILTKREIHLFAPEYMLIELEKYEELIRSKTKRGDIDRYMDLLLQSVEIIPSEDIKQFISEAKQICQDPNDIEFFACALYLKCAIWSNDKEMKNQDRVHVFSTEELIKAFSHI